jgi:hypothetical protein
VILDRDSKFDDDVTAFLKATGLKPKRTGIQSPCQNGIAERWIGSCRREILDHVIALNEQHLRRLIREYVSYHHQDRIHDSLEKDTPNRRQVEQKPAANATVISIPSLGGLHHRYAWREAAWNGNQFLSVIAGITDELDGAAGLVEEGNPNDSVADIQANRFAECLRKSALAFCSRHLPDRIHSQITVA